MIERLMKALKDQRGQIGFGGQSSQTQQKTSIAPQDPTAQSLEALNLKAAQQADADQTAYRASPQYALDQQISQQAKQNVADRLSGNAPVLTDAQQKQLDTAYNATNVEGLRDINTTFANDAASRGLSVTDSPVGNAKGLAVGEFARGMASNKANAALNLGQTGAIFNQGLASYQDTLRMNAATNRMSTLTGYTNPALQYGLGQQYGNRNMSGLGSGFQYGTSASGGTGTSGSNISGLWS